MKSIRLALLASILAVAVAGSTIVPARADQAAGAASSDTMKKPMKKKMAKKTKKAKKSMAKKSMAKKKKPAAANGTTKTQ